VIAVKNIPGLMEITVLQHLPMDAGTRYATSTLAKYVIMVVGVVVSFGAIGVGWEDIQWIVAAMTVGLGFGLQEIFGNFVSGIIMLFERPVRVGDTVTIDSISGTVTRIRMRATTITDWNRKELIVPNKEFVTGKLVNWSLSEPILRLEIPVGIAYGSDTELAAKLLVQVAKSDPNVLDDPAPRAVFRGFGDSALNFELRAFIPNIDHYVSTTHDLLMAIDKTFRHHHITIAFPQRDVHLHTIEATLPVTSNPPISGSGGGPSDSPEPRVSG
jgi:potassium efflux system protein